MKALCYCFMVLNRKYWLLNYSENILNISSNELEKSRIIWTNSNPWIIPHCLLLSAKKVIVGIIYFNWLEAVLNVGLKQFILNTFDSIGVELIQKNAMLNTVESSAYWDHWRFQLGNCHTLLTHKRIYSWRNLRCDPVY